MWVLAAAAWMLFQGMPITRLAGGVPDQAGAGQPAASAPQLPAGLPVTHLETGDSAATLDSPRRLSLSFVESRPFEEVLRLLVAGTPFSLAIDRGVTGTFSGELKQLTLREALRTVLTPIGLQFEVNGSVIHITQAGGELRQFDLNVLDVQRGLTRSAGGGTAALVTSTPAEDVFASIAEGIQALLSPNGRVHIDRRAGLAQVTDAPERLDRVALYLEALQVRRGRQVRLEARVIEVTLRDAPAIDWRAVREKLGLPRDAPQAGLASDPAALQTALAAQGDVRVLSAPDVTAMNNEPALVRAGTPGVSSLTMTVVPQISADGIVQLSLSHAFEEQDAAHAPVRTTETDTVARVTDGNTVMIAGLLRPAVAVSSAHAELVVLLRATVVTPGERAVGRAAR